MRIASHFVVPSHIMKTESPLKNWEALLFSVPFKSLKERLHHMLTLRELGPNWRTGQPTYDGFSGENHPFSQAVYARGGEGGRGDNVLN